MSRAGAFAIGLLLHLAPLAAVTVEGEIDFVTITAAPVTSRAGISVAIDPFTGAPGMRTVTDASGRFAFTGLDAGDYDLSATGANGFGAQRFLRVGARDPHTVQLLLSTYRDGLITSGFWGLLALLLCGAFAAGMMLYGAGRTRKQTSAPRSLTVGFVLWSLGFGLLSQLAPEMQPLLFDIAKGLSAITAALMAGCVVLLVIELELPWQAALGGLIAGLLLQFAIREVDAPPELLAIGSGLGLLLWTSAAGWLLALWLRRHSYLVLAAITIAIMDFYSVFYGPTGQIVSGERPALAVIVEVGLLPWPILGSNLITGVIGLGDFLFLAWFLAAALRFELGLTRNYWALMAAFTIGIVMTLALVAAQQIEHGLPALPFMSLLFLLVNRDRFDLPREDRRRIFGFVALLIVVVAVLIGLRKRHEPVEREEYVVSNEMPTAPLAAAALPWDRQRVRAPELGLREEEEQPARGCRVRPLRFIAGPRAVAGVLAYPLTGEPNAALLHLPERGHAASTQLACQFARRGYLTLSVDWSGGVPESYLAEAFEVLPTLDRSPLYAGGVAAERALQVLEQQAGELPLGVFGDGWGGLLGLTLTSDQPAVDALVIRSVGAVEDDPGRVGEALSQRSAQIRERWLSAFGPERYATRVTQPAMLIGTTNDRWFSLPGQQRLFAALAADDKRLVLDANLDHEPSRARLGEAEVWLDYTLRDQPAPLRTPILSVEPAGGHARLGMRGFSLPSCRAATFYLAPAQDGWSGRYWIPVAAERTVDGWRAEVELAAPASDFAIYAAATGLDGSVVCSELRQIDAAALALVVQPMIWPSPFLATFGEHQEGWRTQVSPLAAAPVDLLRDPQGFLEARVGGEDATAVELVSNNVEMLRRLGSVASGLELSLEPGGTERPLTLAIVERFGQVGEERFLATAAPRGGRRQVLRYPMSDFRAANRSRTIDWERVDGIALTTAREPGPPLRLHYLRMYGPTVGVVQKVPLQ